MRQRSKFAVGLVISLSGLSSAFALTGCEDGPSQTFAPAPVNAGNLWNNGDPNPVVTSGPAGFDAGFGALTALQHCTADQQRLVWANMMQQPIIPPFRFAGLNMAYDTHFSGITRQEAEAINCTGNVLDQNDISWGNNGEVVFNFNSSNYRVNTIMLNLGYQGKMTFHQQVGAKGTNGKCAVVSRFENSPTPDPDPTNCTGHSYEFQLGQPILKDGQVVLIDWNNHGSDSVINEIFNGLMATFGKEANAYNPSGDYDSASCIADGACGDYYDLNAAVYTGGQCAVGFMPLGQLLMVTDCSTGVQPTVSIPTFLENQYLLSEPYTNMASVAQLSAQGPLTLPRYNNTTDPQQCNMMLGMDWKTYVKYCVDLPGTAGTEQATTLADAGLLGDASMTQNQVNEAMAIAAPSFDNENWTFSVVGITPSWTDETVERNPQTIIQDGVVPSITDPYQALMTSWDTNAWNEGAPRNDTSASTFTGQGSGYVYREFARLAQADVNKRLAAAHPDRVTSGGHDGGAPTTIYNHVIGDPACGIAPAAAAAIGCTGLEGLAIQGSGDPADGCSGSNPAPICNNLSAGAWLGNQQLGGYGVTVLKPGFTFSFFLQNPAQPSNITLTYGGLWPQALAQVQAYAGGGNLQYLPSEIADPRFYFRWYAIALVKYLKAYGANHDATAADVALQTLDLESLFFDLSGIDNVEYVERSFMTNTATTYVGEAPGAAGAPGAVTVPASVNAAPMDIIYGASTRTGQADYMEWQRFMYRQETAMFQAMLEKKTDLPGSENNVNLTNLAGSKMLAQNYASYECATQWPVVTMPGRVAGDPPITGAWIDVCGNACPAVSTTGCPPPPLKDDGHGNQVLQLDLNGENPGLGTGGNTPRLARYKAVWGHGAACVDPNAASTPTSQLDPTKPGNNPYITYTGSAGPCFNAARGGVFGNGYPVATAAGSVFAVGQRDRATSRIQYVGADATHPHASTNSQNLTAWISVPDMPDPYNAITLPGSPAATTIQVLAPWSPSVDNSGLSVPIDGLRDKFYQTETLYFGGVVEAYTLRVLPWQDPITKVPDGTLTVEAIDASDFLGEVFLCQDSGVTTDLLGVHMYDTAASILDWIAAHPGSETNCNLVVRYTIYDNYVDIISSLNAGVKVDIGTGAGAGRAVGAVAYDPTLSFAP